MSSGGQLTETARRELEQDAAILRETGRVRNDVLKRALAIAACEHARRLGIGVEQGTVLMLVWIMQASDEIEREVR